MKIKKILSLVALPMVCLAVNAQEKGPQKNDFTVAATVSYNNNVMQNAKPGNRTGYSVTATSKAGIMYSSAQRTRASGVR